ncbi:hypothetical protein [Rhizobium laguerreae]|uniref:hypothetical protein n=1 Tax=Rhizobium laguerreae TaxID=1076926 RepID=UPI001C92B3F0|nr:hypothetical protein [Rhizobium laguerreae]MBY3201367.1 hypothetical protein [Rhizobium laguerreae]
MEFMSTVNVLNEISRTQRSASPGSGNRPHGYAHFELVALDQAVLTAEERPGDEWDIWSAMAEVFVAINKELRSRGAYELRLIDYGSFLTLLETRTEPLDA